MGFSTYVKTPYECVFSDGSQILYPLFGNNKKKPVETMGECKSPLSCLAEVAEADMVTLKETALGTNKVEHCSQSDQTSAYVKAIDETGLPLASTRKAKRGSRKQALRSEESSQTMQKSILDEISCRSEEHMLAKDQESKKGDKRRQTCQKKVVSGSLRGSAIWFSLQSALDQNEHYPFPQIPKQYLKIMDGKLQVSYVKKYLAKKLELQCETEIELRCHGQPVISTLSLENVRRRWFAYFKKGIDGDGWRRTLSAKDLLIVLTYGRRTQV